MKRTHSIQAQFLATILIAILLVAGLIGGLSIFEVGKYVDTATYDLITAKCEKEAELVNSAFAGMEKSVMMMESYVHGHLPAGTDLTVPDTFAQLAADVDKVYSELAARTEGVLAYYLRFAPEVSHPGLYYSKRPGVQGFVRMTPTDLNRYPKDDREHVGWFWEPYESGSAVWLEPYHDAASDVLMISYVIPMYVNGRFIGVVGMDFDYDALIAQVNAIKIGEYGFAYLESDGVIAYHKDLTSGTPVPERDARDICVSSELGNGMTLVVTADHRDTDAIRFGIIEKLVVLVSGLTLIFVLIIIWIVRRIVKPLKKLTLAAEKLANEEYDVEIGHSKVREIELLSSTFARMASVLRKHNDLQNVLAYRDSLTGLYNANAYKAWVTDFDREIEKNSIGLFAVMVLDINNLKLVNDRLGHDTGNKLIASTAELLSRVFRHSPIFRVGGDEFLIILQSHDLQSFAGLLHKFQTESDAATVSAGEQEIPISVAYGTAIFDPEQDKTFDEVFRRADEAMYTKKREMKESL